MHFLKPQLFYCALLQKDEHFSSRNRFIISFPKKSKRNSILINTLYRGVDY